MLFFTSWALWEKLTFVLGGALVTVFLIGYVKLWWSNRTVRKHELRDEEKQMRRDEILRSGNIIVTPPEEEEIPFGVRALEKGVEIDGIWFSKNSKPIPEHLRIGTYVKRGSSASLLPVPNAGSSKSSLTIPSFKDGGRRIFSGIGVSKPTTDSKSPSEPKSSTETNPTTQALLGSDMQHGDGAVESSPARRTYQPTRSSHLRSSNYNENEAKYDAIALGQLEGTSSIKDNIQVRRPCGARPIPIDNPSSISLADNERSSGDSMSSDDISTAAHTLRRATARLPSGQGEYSSIPRPSTSVGDSSADPFITPNHTPSASETSSKYKIQAPSIYHTVGESTATEAEFLMDTSSRDPSPDRRSTSFDANVSLANRDTRHVNPSFSIFPAGTFAARREIESAAARPSTGDSQGSTSQVSQTSQTSKPKRTMNKLKKKAKFSFSGPRNSTDLR